MKVQAIIPTAGIGRRLEAKEKKPFIKLNGKPIFIHTLAAFEACAVIDSIILVVHKEYIDAFRKNIQDYKIQKVADIVVGGETRRESVANGLQALDEDTEFVAIHDGARPLITPEGISKAVELAFAHSAVTTAVPVKPTIKQVDAEKMSVVRTLNRQQLWETQTPQIFQKSLILKAHDQYQGQPTDDASMVEEMGAEVKVVEGDYKNIKITTSEDLTLAENLLNAGSHV